LIQELTQRNEKLQEEMGRMLEEQKKRDGLWNSAQKIISAERSSRETAAQLKQVCSCELSNFVKRPRPKLTDRFFSCYVMSDNLCQGGGRARQATPSPVGSREANTSISETRSRTTGYNRKPG
jgi:hypothetical protein